MRTHLFRVIITIDSKTIIIVVHVMMMGIQFIGFVQQIQCDHGLREFRAIDQLAYLWKQILQITLIHTYI